MVFDGLIYQGDRTVLLMKRRCVGPRRRQEGMIRNDITNTVGTASIGIESRADTEVTKN